MIKVNIPIKGMHCRSCEILIEEKLQELKQVKKVKVSWKEKQAEVFSDQPLDQSILNQAIIDAGYEVGSDNKDWVSRDKTKWKDLIYATAIILVLYIIAKKFGLGSFGVSTSGELPSLLVVLVVGLTAGVSTCMALVGGLILGISARHAEIHPEATPLQKFRPHLFFNLGRISSYIILGGLIGLAGHAFQFSGTVLGMLTIVVGLVMLLLGLQLIEVFPRLASNSFTLPSSLSKFLGIKKHHHQEYSHTNSMIIGALTFFLPCGFTQAMQLYAMSTGNFWSGALIMGTFALGTAPGLLGVGGLTSIIKGVAAQKFFKFVGLLVVFLAIFNISNGINLTGLSAKLSSIKLVKSTVVKDDANVKLENGVQVARMEQYSTGYRPSKFTVKQGVPVKWIINSTDANSCAASIYSPQLNVRKYLQPGENIIEFTPDKTGRISFSCSMGMYKGYFDVVENVSSAPQNAEAKQTQSTNIQVEPDQIPFNGQILKTTYTAKDDILPNRLTASVGQPTRLEVDVQDDGVGCMSSITIPGLVDNFDVLEKNKKIVFEFTPQKAGEYYITCAMHVPRGLITVI